MGVDGESVSDTIKRGPKPDPVVEMEDIELDRNGLGLPKAGEAGDVPCNAVGL